MYQVNGRLLDTLYHNPALIPSIVTLREHRVTGDMFCLLGTPKTRNPFYVNVLKVELGARLVVAQRSDVRTQLTS